jgi:hypothetical protein
MKISAHPMEDAHSAGKPFDRDDASATPGVLNLSRLNGFSTQTPYHRGRPGDEMKRIRGDSDFLIIPQKGSNSETPLR